MPIIDVNADLEQVYAVKFRAYVGDECVGEALSAQRELSLEPICARQQSASELRRRGRARSWCRCLW